MSVCFAADVIRSNKPSICDQLIMSFESSGNFLLEKEMNKSFENTFADLLIFKNKFCNINY